MTRAELLNLIGESGAYCDSVPNDDETNALLSQLMDEGSIRGEQTRTGDFFWLTKKGRRELLADR